MKGPVLVFTAPPRPPRRRRLTADPVVERITAAARTMAKAGRVAYLHVLLRLLEDAAAECDSGPCAG